MPVKPVLILGSSGNVGFATVNALSSNGTTTRAGVRDPSSEKAKQLAALANVEVVAADLGNTSSLAAAMAGVDTVYIVVPGHPDRVALAAAGVDAAKAAGLTHIVVVSVPSVKSSGDLIFKKQFEAIETKVSSSGLKYTILRLPMFFDNQFMSQGTIKQGQIYGPADPAKPVTLISVADVGGASANVLANAGKHVNKTYTLGADTLTFADIAAAFAAGTGQKVAYVQVPYPAATESMMGMGFPEIMANGMAELMKIIDDGNAAVFAHSDLESLLGKAPTKFAAWVSGVAGAFKA